MTSSSFPPPPPASGYIRLATASPASGPSTAATLAHLRLLARRAATTHHADILLLPEAYVGGYPRGSAFGCVVGARTAEGREEFLRYWEQAVDLGDVVGEGSAGGGEEWVRRRLPGDGEGLGELLWEEEEMKKEEEEEEEEEEERKAKKNKRGDGTREVLEEIAAETGVFLVTGLIEKAGGSLYCAVVYVCPKRGMIGKRRKVLPTGTERLIWAQGSPRTLQAVSTLIRGVRINLAAAICWESYMPLLRQTLYAQNINLYLAPTADGRDAWLGLMRTVGVEGRCFVVSSNMCVRRDPSPTGGGAGDDEEGEEKGDVPPYEPRRNIGRRNSAITEDGFEIALPKTKVGTTTTTTATTLPNGKNKNNNTAAGEEKFISRGGSCITNPFGDVLAGPSWEDDGEIIYADVDFKDCIRGRLDSDAAGSYSRSDSFKLSVEGFTPIPLPY